MKKIIFSLLLLPISSFLFAQTPFILLEPAQSGITFANKLEATGKLNVYTYLNFYNGGGVAVGDVNNDGLPDLYFTGNQVPDQLYLNKGNMQFEDVTAQAKIKNEGGFTLGVSMVDVNGDNLVDIYICRAGSFEENSPLLTNQLWINQGDMTFKEEAKKRGLADRGRSVHATFFDYDHDNDLDVYVLNHPEDFYAPVDVRSKLERERPDRDTDRLYRNDGAGVFTDVTDEAGVRNWGFGLSCTAADFNRDGWMDLYIAQDYSERDSYLINQKDGTFQERLFESFMHTSNFTMGADAADFNNDGLMDLVTVDMVAEDNRRKKANMSGMNPETFWDNVNRGRHYQYMQNMLQLNNGNGTFSEIAELAGVAYTDWSWAPLFGDLDNDGMKDLFITNGMRRDVRNADYMKKLREAPYMDIEKEHAKWAEKIPVEPISNYVYRNRGNFTFAKVSQEWGFDWKGFSQGLALADLDRDGDLDVVMNNLDDVSRIYENESPRRHFLQIKGKGLGANTQGIGMRVEMITENGGQMQEMTTSRGYLSSADPILHFGLGDAETINQVKVIWPSGRAQIFRDVPVDQFLEVSEEAATEEDPFTLPNPWLRNTTVRTRLSFTHKEIPFDDYKEQVLLPHKYSQLGPPLATADIDGNGLVDVYIGGANGMTGKTFVHERKRKFDEGAIQSWEGDVQEEDTGALFFDADGDGDLDLYVCSGSNEWPIGSPHYQDRLYLNEGNQKFEKSENMLPALSISSSSVAAADIDGDGDMDLCVGGRMVPGQYPAPAPTTILENRDKRFVDVTAEWAPELKAAGLITDVQWVDYDKDGDQDLFLAGEWMPIKVFENTGNKLVEKTEEAGLAAFKGWWYSLTPCDPDQDGDMDFVAGNLGLNSKYQASMEEPLQVYYHDYDRNGSKDVVLVYFNEGEAYPVRGRSCSSEQIPELADQFPTYDAFSKATMTEIFGPDLSEGLRLEATWMASSYIENQGNGQFKVKPLPMEAQFSTAHAVAVEDLTGDGIPDIVLAGNMLQAEVETCRHDASIGTILKGNGKGNWSPLPWLITGFFASGDVKDLAVVKDEQHVPMIIVSRSNGSVTVHTFR